MAQSKVEIANSALVKIGAEVILSFDDDSKEAQLVNVRYDPVRRTVLRMHPWNSAVKRVVSSATSTTPDFDFSYQHQLPSDCLRVLEANVEDDIEYRIEGRLLLTDKQEIELKYIYDLEDTAEMDSLLSEAIATYLAFDIAYAITQNGTVRDSMFGLFERMVRTAKSVDGQEESRKLLEANQWDEARLGSTIDRSGR